MFSYIEKLFGFLNEAYKKTKKKIVTYPSSPEVNAISTGPVDSVAVMDAAKMEMTTRTITTYPKPSYRKDVPSSHSRSSITVPSSRRDDTPYYPYGDVSYHPYTPKYDYQKEDMSGKTDNVCYNPSSSPSIMKSCSSYDSSSSSDSSSSDGGGD